MAIAAIKGDKTLAELAEPFDVHPNRISEWKQPLQESAADVFDGGPKKKAVKPDLKVAPRGAPKARTSNRKGRT